MSEELWKNEKLWEKVNQECGEDIIDIVMGFSNYRFTAGETMDKIAKRCLISAKVFTKELRTQSSTSVTPSKKDDKD